MYGIFPYIYHKHQPNVGKYTIRSRIHTHPYKSDFSGSNLIPRVGFNHQTFQVPKMEESSPI